MTSLSWGVCSIAVQQLQWEDEKTVSRGPASPHLPDERGDEGGLDRVDHRVLLVVDPQDDPDGREDERVEGEQEPRQEAALENVPIEIIGWVCLKMVSDEFGYSIDWRHR